MAKNKKLFVRVDERMHMLITELSGIAGVSISVVVRGMLKRCIEGLLDEKGNWKRTNANNKTEEDT